MKPALIVVLGLALFLTGCKERNRQPSGEPTVAQDEPAKTDRPLQSVASVVSDLKATPDPAKAREQVGELWSQANRLKREGRNTRNIEGLLSDLEANLRSNQQDAAARRHLANELEYEVQALKRKDR